MDKTVYINKTNTKDYTEITQIEELTPDVYYKFYVIDPKTIMDLSDFELKILNIILYTSIYPVKKMIIWEKLHPEDKDNKYKGNFIKLDQLEEYVKKNTDIDLDTLHNVFNSFIEKDFLKKKEGDDNIYRLNTDYFFTGTIDDTTKSIKVSTLYKRQMPEKTSKVSEPHIIYKVSCDLPDKYTPLFLAPDNK